MRSMPILLLKISRIYSKLFKLGTVPQMKIDNILVRLFGFSLIILSVYSLGSFFLIKASDSAFYHSFSWVVLFSWNVLLLFFSSQYPIRKLRKRGCLMYGIVCVMLSTIIWGFTIIQIMYLTVSIPAYQDNIFLRACGVLVSFGVTLTCIYQLWNGGIHKDGIRE